MKMVQKCLSALPLVMLFVSCTVNGDYKTIESKLHGTWESTDTSLYSGKLVIRSATITIIGYDKSQTPFWYGDDAKRPFRDFAKNVPFACYTDDEKLFIMTIGGEKSVPYYYHYSASTLEKFLHFSFGDREEALKRTGN
jgi:hypothetical protein